PLLYPHRSKTIIERGAKMVGKLVLFVLACGLGSGGLSVPAYGQSLGNVLGNTVERAARDELRRKAAEETRRAVRCVLGDADCVEGTADAASASASASAGTSGAAQSGAAGAAVPVGTGFVLTPYPGSVPNTSSPRNNRVEAYTEYERITASAPGPTRNYRETERLEGRLTVRELRHPQDRSMFEIERNYLDAL